MPVLLWVLLRAGATKGLMNERFFSGKDLGEIRAGAEEKERKVTWEEYPSDQLGMLAWTGLDHTHVLSPGWHHGTLVGLW